VHPPAPPIKRQTPRSTLAWCSFAGCSLLNTQAQIRPLLVPNLPRGSNPASTDAVRMLDQDGAAELIRGSSAGSAFPMHRQPSNWVLGRRGGHLIAEKAPKGAEFGQAAAFWDDVIQLHWLYAFWAIWRGFDGHAQKVGARSWLSAWPHAAQR
jgi:hypothetical protein